MGLQTVNAMWEPEGTFLFLFSCILWVRLAFAAITDEARGPPLGEASKPGFTDYATDAAVS